MRLKIETPINGDRRTAKRFAWFPRIVESHLIWLEFYLSEEEYVKSSDSLEKGDYWKVTDRYLIGGCST